MATPRLSPAGTLAGETWPTVLSPCRTWRYLLGRGACSGATVLFVGLNPSTADESTDDPTVRKCLGFARRWGMDGVLLANLFAYRATDPKALRDVADPVGPDADRWLRWALERADVAVAAWGAVPARWHGRAHEVARLAPGRWRCLARTRDGHPRHPLYAPYATARWRDLPRWSAPGAEG